MEKYQKHIEICKLLNDIYKRKNTDYNDSFGKSFSEHGMYASLIRMEDKFLRFKNLSKNQAEVRDETLKDTLIDLANYSIMTIIEMEQNRDKQTAIINEPVHQVDAFRCAVESLKEKRKVEGNCDKCKDVNAPANSLPCKDCSHLNGDESLINHFREAVKKEDK